jgi:hypothetical protein
MDPRQRADAVLSRAETRRGVVTPGNMVSPMDAANTQQIPRSVVDGIDSDDPDSTTVLPSTLIERNDSHLADSPATGRIEPAATTPHAAKAPETTAAAPEAGACPESRNAPGGERTEISGLVPTTRVWPTQSDVARRLEGL